MTNALGHGNAKGKQMEVAVVEGVFHMAWQMCVKTRCVVGVRGSESQEAEIKKTRMPWTTECPPHTIHA